MFALFRQTRFQLLLVWAGLLLAFPPINLCWLAFFALIPLIRLILKPERERWLYVHLWICGTLFWICEAHFVRFPHPVNYVLLGGLGCYLGVYLPLFVAIARRWMHGVLPRILSREMTEDDRSMAALWVIPLAWAACDILRYWMLTGYFMSSLCHAFYRWTFFIQTADIFGEWGTTMTVVFLACCLATCVRGRKPRWTAICAAVLMAGFITSYGFLRQIPLEPDRGCIALLQGNIPAQLSVDEQMTRNTEMQYLELVQKAKAKTDRPVDLLVFPESIYRRMIVFAEENARVPIGLIDEATGKPMTEAVFRERLAQVASSTQRQFASFVAYCGRPVVTGCGMDVYTADGVKSYNSALYMRPNELVPQPGYSKMHLVPFGEYVPFLRTLKRLFPSVERLSPIGAGGEMGERAVAFTFPTKDGELTASMSICFESAVGRLLRRQLAALRAQGIEPDFFLNVTNNGWFGQSNESKLHLACGVFRAVENRKPVLVAANYGISANIDGNGVIRQQIPTGQPGVLLAAVPPDPRTTLFSRWGHVFLWIPLVFAGAAFPFGRRSAK